MFLLIQWDSSPLLLFSLSSPLLIFLLSSPPSSSLLFSLLPSSFSSFLSFPRGEGGERMWDELRIAFRSPLFLQINCFLQFFDVCLHGFKILGGFLYMIITNVHLHSFTNFSLQYFPHLSRI
jgi:hypothetical protein